MSGNSNGASCFSSAAKACASTSSEPLPTNTCSGRTWWYVASAARNAWACGSGYSRSESVASPRIASSARGEGRSEEHTSELQSLTNIVCRLLLEKKKNKHLSQNRGNRLLIANIEVFDNRVNASRII